MGYMEYGLSHLNRMFGDPAFLRENREQLLALYRPSDELDEREPGVLQSTRQMLGDGSPLGKAVEGIDPEQIAGILRQQPPTIIEAQRAVVYRNLRREQPYGMTFAWRPGYEHEVTIWESSASKDGPGWITIQIQSRYPLDRHPMSE